MKLTGLKLNNPNIAIDHTISRSTAIVEIKLDTTILCQRCHENERISSQHFICYKCQNEQNKDIAAGINERNKNNDNNATLPIVEAVPTVVTSADSAINSETLKLETNIKLSERSIRFAPPSVRYDGKKLDEIAWAMAPAMPAETLLEIRKMAPDLARKIISQDVEPSIQDIEVQAECYLALGNILKSLVTGRKEKLVLAAKPELKRQEKERKEAEKEAKIQASIPRDVTSKHTANILLNGIATIVNPADKDKQSLLKKFLDYVNLQHQMEDEIDSAWLQKALTKPMYAPLKQYFKINS